MCGITGWFQLDIDEAERLPLLRRMCETIHHRGPDDQGLYVDRLVGLGIQRLSIVDLEGGHQPMASENGEVQVVFNGEIYNHVALRAELRRHGVAFRTVSDTEVILRLYEREGLRAFERMNGMFGVAIWDRRDATLHLVRDRLGVKPLYYAWTGRSLVFGSEIKAILASGHVEQTINPRAIWDYLTFRYVPAPETIWAGIRKLPPGHRLSVRAGTLQPEIARWWGLAMRTAGPATPDAEYEYEFAELFDDAVRLRMLADVPVGITLSGGLDSSAVAAAARAGGCNLKTFCVAFADSPETDELSRARQVANHLGADQQEIVIGRREFMDFLPDLVWYTDEPLADLASVPLYYVSKLARKNVKVVLSGEGSDEVFGGYTFDRWARYWDEAAQARSRARWASGRIGALAARVVPTVARERELAAAVCDQRQLAEPLTMTNYWSSADKTAMLRGNAAWPDSLDSVRAQLAHLGDQHPLNQALYVYCQDWLVEDLLMKADRMSMANSLELRTPFLDYRLVEWAGRLPTHLKVGPAANGVYRTKEVLRRYAAKRLPEAVITRPKQGFPVPVYDWLSGVLESWARETLMAPGAQVRAWLTDEAMERVVAEGTAPGSGMMARHRLWNLLILEIWMRRWLH
jgi:asparagine synthase (glutamine-hydrolysing)